MFWDYVPRAYKVPTSAFYELEDPTRPVNGDPPIIPPFVKCDAMMSVYYN